MSKKQHPYLKANALNKLYHSWVSSLLRLSRQRPLEYDDLFDILPDDRSEPWIDRLEKAWEYQLKRSHESISKKHHPSLIRATWSMCWRRHTLIGIYLFFYTMLRFTQPFVLARFIRYFVPCSNVSLREVIFWGALNCLFPWLMAVLRQMAYTRGSLEGMHLLCAYSGLIFQKIVRLSMGSIGSHSSGKVVNLITNDVQTVDHLAFNVNFIWIGILETIVVLAVLWSYVGSSIFLAIIYTVFVLLLQTLCGKFMQMIWKKRVRQTDLRLKLMNEIVRSIHLIKMYVWERPFQLKVERVRRKEIFYLIAQSFVNTIKIVNGYSFPSIFFLIIFGLLWYRQAQFDTNFFIVAFVLVSYLRHTYLRGFAISCADLLQYWVAVHRIETFLISPEYHRSKVTIQNESSDRDNLILDVQHVFSTWENSSFHLRDVTFSTRTGELTMIIGPIASGKSSLLMTLIGETNINSGTITINREARFCYVPQESWIFSGSIKENILFGLDYDERKFNQCIYAAALDTDIANLPYGDSTLVGDNGIILSGGQKARVSLARALYRDEEIYLLDDPLSAVDVRVGRHIFERCILGQLRSKVCILVTHQIQYLKYATKIIFLDRGVQISSGTYGELRETCPVFNQWTEATIQNSSTTNSESESSSQTTEFVKQPSLTPDNSNLDENKPLLEPTTNKAIQIQAPELKFTGSIRFSAFVRYIQAGACSFFGIILIFLLFIASSTINLFVNWWLGRWADAERIRYGLNSTNNSCTTHNQSSISKMTVDEWHHERNRYFFILLGFVVFYIIVLFLRTFSYFVSCHVASRTLHHQMFNAILRVPVLFFDSTPVGRVVNRFSKDISSIDEKLCETSYTFVEGFFNIISTVLFIVFVQPFSLTPVVLSGAIMEWIRRMFAAGVRDIKRLESLSRSPIYSYVLSTMQGVPLIRSYGVQAMCVKEFIRHLDEYNRPHSVMLSINMWAAMKIDTVVVALITFLTISIFFVHRNLPSSDLGLLLAYSIALIGNVQAIFRLFVDVMIQMTSVERVLEYIDLQPEELPANRNSIALPAHWPRGSMTFDNLSFRYAPNSPWVLDKNNVSIRSGEKIGIVGRTGAGKSSIIQSLFRMAELNGRILIDDIDIERISLYELRRRISIIPQDPVLFNDTLRRNLDPFGEYSDYEIRNALNEVQLKSNLIEDLSQQVTEGGSNFSAGQRQLLCLARALLRKNRILVIDEATANVDHKTDELVQLVIRRKFTQCTILTIAHRLRTIIDSDKILILSNGRVVEFASAYDLLIDEHSYFAQLVSQTGQDEAKYLFEQAKLLNKNTN